MKPPPRGVVATEKTAARRDASAPSTTAADRALATLKGVGPVRAGALAQAGLTTARDLLMLRPRRHLPLPPATSIAALADGARLGEDVTVTGEIVRSRRKAARGRGRSHLELDLDDGSGRLRVTFFNRGWLADGLKPGDRLRVTGRLREIAPPRLDPFHHEPAGEPVRPLLVEYPRVPDVPPRLLRRLIAASLSEVKPVDPLPEDLRARRELVGLREALAHLHEPSGPAAVADAERRLLYQGFLALALKVEGGRERAHSAGSAQAVRTAGLSATLASAFPFRFTRAQTRAIGEIAADLGRRTPMRRLLQGDVGSGKTAVALWAAFATGLARRQTAVMAPTEALAEQLAAVARSVGEPLGLRVGYLSGSLRGSERRRVLAAAAAHELDLLVGTQAVFGRDVALPALGLVVVDEQHRFGVMQRLKLVRKGERPHLLGMSATPIPRTLALTIWSDLDLSLLDELPPHRRPVVTRHHARERDGAFDWDDLARRARAGEKAFVVFPAIESASAGVASLLDHGRRIARRHFGGVPVAALHGRMSDEEKRESLRRFRDGVVSVLFATSVIEVGIDVPDARTIVVVDADRFGLAQLHQLRGRVGRGGHDGRCWLLTRRLERTEAGRLATLVSCADGFAIAERDLELRGPGDMMGLRQHGTIPTLPEAEEDRRLMEAAFTDARELLARGTDAARLAAALEAWTPARRRRGVDLLDAG